MARAIKISLSERQLIAVCPRSVNTNGHLVTPLPPCGRKGHGRGCLNTTTEHVSPSTMQSLSVAAPFPRYGRRVCAVGVTGNVVNEDSDLEASSPPNKPQSI